MSTTDFDSARDFISRLYSRYFTDHDGYVELRFIASTSGNTLTKWLRKGELTERDWEETTRQNESHNVFIGVNPRPLSQARKQEDITDIICLWADIDGKDCAGGKQEALTRAKAFPLPPTILVDSGHGVHCYWVLEQPVALANKEQRAAFKQLLSGIVDHLGADASKLHMDSLLRLPGTRNIKDHDRPVDCSVVEVKEQLYDLSIFEEFRNTEYSEPKGATDAPPPKFGTRTAEVSHSSSDEMKRDLERLVVPDDIKHLIATGELVRGDRVYPTRSERDMAIICSLIYWGYDWDTVRSIFYNPLLGCSNRFRDLSEKELQWDVRTALEFIKKWQIEETPEAAHITEIKESTKGEERRKAILNFIMSDLLTGGRPVGRGFKDEIFDRYYFFNSATKLLMNLDSTEFYTFIRFRYRVPERDFNEIRDEMKTVIIHHLHAFVTPRQVSYWDKDKFVLYVSDNANGIYRLDGDSIYRCDNGTDGVFFEYDPALTPWAFDPEQEVVNYFETEQAAQQIGSVTVAPAPKLGLNLDRFEESLLNRYLVSLARFSTDKDNPLTPWHQRLMLIVYFYSLFFESRLKEKPIACFVGSKESGKSLMLTCIGKVFDGDTFEPSGLPRTADDLAVVMGRRRYLVMDNLDNRIPADMLNLICAAATGVSWKKRELYKDGVEISITPHCFLAITSREPKFTRDDMVSRLLLFTTQKIDKPISRSDLIGPLLMNRSALLTEVMVNLQSIITLLLLAEDRRDTLGSTRCVSRLADWETLGRALCGNSAALWQFVDGLELMNAEKDILAIESEVVYQVLYWAVYENNQLLTAQNTNSLYRDMAEAAEKMKIKDFTKLCKSPVSLGKWLGHNLQELRRRFDIDVLPLPNTQREYTIRRLAAAAALTFSEEAMMAMAGTRDIEEIAAQLSEAYPGLWLRRDDGRYIVRGE